MNSMKSFWHGSDLPRPKLLAGLDGGVHLGSEAQARMRNSAFLHEVAFSPASSRRSRDTGGGWAGKISDARSRGFDAIFYLNRYEGILQEELDLAIKADGLPDAEFRQLVPSSADSCIALDPSMLRVISITPGPGCLTLYHGTTDGNATRLLRNGFDPKTSPEHGANCGQRGRLYLTTGIEDARWFSNEAGSDVVLKLRIPANQLQLDPEDSIGRSVVEEISEAVRFGLPAKLSITSIISPHSIRSIELSSPGLFPSP